MPLFSDISVAESDALEALYAATTGASWTDNSGWVPGDGTYDGTAASAFGITVAGGHVTEINLPNSNLDGDITAWSFTPFVPLNKFNVLNNASLSGDVTSWSPPQNMTNWFWLGNTGLTGDVSNFFPTKAPINIRYHNTALTGTYSGYVLPSGLSDVYTYSSDVTGVLAFSGASTVARIRIQNTAMTTADVDENINSIYTNRNNFTDAAPELNIGGTNAAPTGVYQYAATPSTPAEKVYALVNDDDGEGFNTWTITYSEKPAVGTGSTANITASQATLNMPVSVPDGGSLTVTFYDASDDSVIDTDTVVGEGTASIDWTGRASATDYTWYAIADDGDTTTQSEDVSFTTSTTGSHNPFYGPMC